MSPHYNLHKSSINQTPSNADKQQKDLFHANSAAVKSIKSRKYNKSEVPDAYNSLGSRTPKRKIDYLAEMRENRLSYEKDSLQGSKRKNLHA